MYRDSLRNNWRATPECSDLHTGAIFTEWLHMRLQSQIIRLVLFKGETLWKTCLYHVENRNMGIYLILLVVVEIGVIKYKKHHKYVSRLFENYILRQVWLVGPHANLCDLLVKINPENSGAIAGTSHNSG